MVSKYANGARLGARYHSLALFHINLVADYDKWEAFGVHWAGLHQELVAPTVQGVEALGVVDIVYEHAAISATVECHAERLESFLPGRVPELHRDQPVVDQDFFG